MRKILAMILHIKSPVTLLFKYSTIQYCCGLSNEILGILLAQGAEKLPVHTAQKGYKKSILEF